MGSLSLAHWMILGIVAVFLFGGRGRLSAVMGDAAQGLRAFKEGLKEPEPPAREPAADIAKRT